MKPTGESEVVLARFEDVCPDTSIDSMSQDDIENSVRIAFEIIGYTPNNFQKAVDKAIDKVGRKGKLYSVCYYAWRLDDE